MKLYGCGKINLEVNTRCLALLDGVVTEEFDNLNTDTKTNT